MKKQLNERKWIAMNILVSLVLTVGVYFVSLLFRGMTFLPDQGANWYYWKLSNPTALTRGTAWIGYGLHQIFVWYLILKMRQEKSSKTKGLTKRNYQLMAVNIGFILLHYLQGGIWYDGLAQDVSVWSSQYSVILMLVLILIMENRRRGLFFGKKINLPKDGTARVYKYHSIYIAWAIVYTFWFHPIEGTAGHLIGFFYMYLIFAQMCFAKTPLHKNRIWTILLEVGVLFHGTMVAILQNNGMWSMFFFGFATMFIVTQMYGLGWSKKIKGGFTAFYIGFAIFVYSGMLFDKEITMIHQITWIPIILYGLVFVVVYLLQIPTYLSTKK